MSIETAEVVAIDKAFKPSRSKFGIPLSLGAVKIRMGKSTGGSPRIERFAFPMFNFQQVPLVGEHIAVTFIDYSAAFDTVSHKFIDRALQQAGASTKIHSMFRAVYEAASAFTSASPSLLPPLPFLRLRCLPLRASTNPMVTPTSSMARSHYIHCQRSMQLCHHEIMLWRNHANPDPCNVSLTMRNTLFSYT